MMKILFTYFLLVPSPFVVYENNIALDSLSDKATKSAGIAYFSKLVQEYPDNLIFLWNLSQAFVANEQFEAAHKLLDYIITNAEKNKNLEVKWLFFAYFNKASIFVAEKKTEEALDYYEKALDIYPDSKEVVVNMELLLSSQGGGGQGDKDEEQDKKQEGEGSGDKKDQDKENNQPKGNPTPKPFKSTDLSKDDVKRILDELKRQEEQIRERLQDDQPKESSNEKDW